MEVERVIFPMQSASSSALVIYLKFEPVRTLQELVYKSIIFNNEDTAGSPVGYENYDKLSITSDHWRPE